MPTPVPVQQSKSVAKLQRHWQVIVLDDPVNLMDYVTLVFQQVLGMSKGKAKKHMLEVHEKGRSVVWSGDREKAEMYVHQLQANQLTALLEKSE